MAGPGSGQCAGVDAGTEQDARAVAADGEAERDDDEGESGPTGKRGEQRARGRQEEHMLPLGIHLPPPRSLPSPGMARGERRRPARAHAHDNVKWILCVSLPPPPPPVPTTQVESGCVCLAILCSLLPSLSSASGVCCARHHPSISASSLLFCKDHLLLPPNTHTHTYLIHTPHVFSLPPPLTTLRHDNLPSPFHKRGLCAAFAIDRSRSRYTSRHRSPSRYPSSLILVVGGEPFCPSRSSRHC